MAARENCSIEKTGVKDTGCDGVLEDESNHLEKLHGNFMFGKPVHATAFLSHHAHPGFPCSVKKVWITCPEKRVYVYFQGFKECPSLQICNEISEG